MFLLIYTNTCKTTSNKSGFYQLNWQQRVIQKFSTVLFHLLQNFVWSAMDPKYGSKMMLLVAFYWMRVIASSESSWHGGILYPRESESREVKSLDGIWNFRRSEDPLIGFREKWFTKDLSRVRKCSLAKSDNVSLCQDSALCITNFRFFLVEINYLVIQDCIFQFILSLI